MSYRIANALKRLTVSTFVRFLSVDRVRRDAPEPRSRDFDGKLCNPAGDDWLFEESASPLAMDVRALANELGRTSSALQGLRQLLTSIAHHAPLTISAQPGAASNMVWSEDLLFDVAPTAVIPSIREPLAGEAAFLFEDDAHASSGWSALQGLRAEPPLAA